MRTVRMLAIPCLLGLTAAPSLTACTLQREEGVGSTDSHLESCGDSNNFKVAGAFCTAFKKYQGPYPKVGVALTNPFSNGRGDTLQVFERVVMNLSPQAPCAGGAACIALAGIDDANETFRETYDGRAQVSCETRTLGRRSFDCLPGAFDLDPRVVEMRNEIQGNLDYYGYMISPVRDTCAWWNADQPTADHTSCFWTERGKIGRAPGGGWEYEAIAAKRLRHGQIPGAPGASGGPDRASEIATSGSLAVDSGNLPSYAAAASELVRKQVCDVAWKTRPGGPPTYASATRFCDGSLNLFELGFAAPFSLNGVPAFGPTGPGGPQYAAPPVGHVAQADSRAGACDLLRGSPGSVDRSALLMPYFFIGGSAGAGALVTANVGVDFVWDLFHQQFAAFAYGGPGFGVGVSAGVYEGLGFGSKLNVVDAWSGPFLNASIGVPVFPPLVSAPVAVFASPDVTVAGASVGLSLGWSPIKVSSNTVQHALDFASSHSGNLATYTEWDDVTANTRRRWDESRLLWVGPRLIETQNGPSQTFPVSGENHTYVQFVGPNDVATSIGMAISMLEFGETAAAPGAALAVAIGLVRAAQPGNRPECQGHQGGKCMTDGAGALRQLCGG